MIKEYLDKKYLAPLKKYYEESEYKKIHHNVSINAEMVIDYLTSVKKIKDNKLYDLEYRLDTERNYNKREVISNKVADYVCQKYYDSAIDYSNTIDELYGFGHTSNIMQIEPTLFKTNWLCHFTDRPYEIVIQKMNGVIKQAIDRLWRTYKTTIKHTKGEGYAFCLRCQ